MQKSSFDKCRSSPRLVLPKLSSSYKHSADLNPSIQAINKIMKADKLKEVMLIKNSTRDVSYIHDSIQRLNTEKPDDLISELTTSTYSLPTDLDSLKDILISTDDLGIPITMNQFGNPEVLSCKKKRCVDIAIMNKNKHKLQPGNPKKHCLSDTPNFIEKLLKTDSVKSLESFPKRVVFLGSPTGRQEVENLQKWLRVMKDEHLKNVENKLNSEEEMYSDTIEAGYIIYNVMIKELIRQVTVQCVERGELLKESIDALFKYWKKLIQSYITAANIQKDRHALELADIKYSHAKQTAKYQVKIKQLAEELERDKRSEEKCMKEIELLRNLLIENKSKNKRKVSDIIQEASTVTQTNHMACTMPVLSSLSPNFKRKSSKRMGARFLSPSVEDENNLSSEVEIEDSSSCISMSEYYHKQEKRDVNTQTEVGVKENIEGLQRQYPIGFRFEKTGFAIYIPKYMKKSSFRGNLKKSRMNQKLLHIESKVLDTEAQNPSCPSDTKVSKFQNLRLDSLDQAHESDINIGKQLKLQDEPRESLNLNIDTQEIPLTDIKTETLPISIYYESPTNLSKDNEYGQDDIVLDEALNDISVQLNQAKQTIKDLDTEITEKTQELVSLNSEISYYKEELNKFSHLEAQNYQMEASEPLSSKLPAREIETFPHINQNLDSSRAQQIDPSSLYSDPQFVSSEKTNQGIEILICDFDKSLYHSDLIPPAADATSWRAGFNTGFETGRTTGIALGEEIGIDKGITEGYCKALIEQKSKDRSYLSTDNQSYLDGSNLDSQDRTCTDYEDFRSISESEDQSPKQNLQIRSRNRYDTNITELGIKNSRSRNTKFYEFSFKRESHIRKVNPAKKILAKFLSRKQTVINRYATMGISTVLRILSLVYINTLSKIKSLEAIDSFLEILYEEMLHKYGIKNVADNKFRETIASMMYHSDCKRVKMLLRLAGLGNRVNMSEYSYLSCKLYMDLLNFMQNFNVGIMVSNDEIAEIQLYPTVRALECVKEKLEPILDKTAISSLLRFIEQKSVSDPKRINKAGLIELELFLEKALDLYEEYQNSIKTGITEVLNHFYSERVSNISKSVVLDLIKNISPSKLSAVQKLIDTELIEIVHFGRAEYESESKSSSSISLTNFINICILSNSLSIREVQSYLQIESHKNLRE